MGESDWNAPSPVSQFVSLDAEGTLMFWSTLVNNYIKDTSNITFDDYMTSIKNETINNNNNNFSSNNNSTNNSTKNKNNNTNITDASSILSTNQFGLSPSGKIALIVTKIIRKQFNITKNIFANITVSDSNNSSKKDDTKNRNSSTNNNNNNNNKNNNPSNNLLLNAFQSTDISVLCPIPNDISTLLLSGNHGKVSKIVRFGEPSNPKDFRRPEIGKMEISAISGKNGR